MQMQLAVFIYDACYFYGRQRNIHLSITPFLPIIGNLEFHPFILLQNPARRRTDYQNGRMAPLPASAKMETRSSKRPPTADGRPPNDR